MTDNEQQTEDAAVEEASRFWHEAVAATESKSIDVSPEPKAKEEPSPESESKEESVEKEPEEESEGEEGKNVEKEAEPEEEQEESEDPWAKLPEEIRKEHEEAVERAKKYEHEARSNRGRLAALERKYKELSSKPESSPAKDDKMEPTVDPVDSIFDSPDWKEFEQNFGTEVALPQKAAMRRMYEVMHSRIQTIEDQARSLQETRYQQEISVETQKFNQDFQKWINRVQDGYEAGEGDPIWFNYVKDNYSELEAFAQTDPDYQKWWTENIDFVTKPSNLLKLFREFEASRDDQSKSEKKDSSAPKTNGASSPKPEPRVLTPKRKLQQTSAAGLAPRSAPGLGSRSNDLPDPKDYAFDFFADKMAR